MQLSALALCLFAGLASAAERPVKILIAYHSETGNTEKLAKAVRDGVAAVEGTEILFRKVDAVTEREMVEANAVLLGTPVYWGGLSAQAKSFLDRLGNTLSKARSMKGEGRLAGAFTTGGAASSGKDLARISVLAAFLNMRFVIMGGVDQGGYGTLGPQATAASGGPSEAELKEARMCGERFARFARLMPPPPNPQP